MGETKIEPTVVLQSWIGTTVVATAGDDVYTGELLGLDRLGILLRCENVAFRQMEPLEVFLSLDRLVVYQEIKESVQQDEPRETVIHHYVPGADSWATNLQRIPDEAPV